LKPKKVGALRPFSAPVRRRTTMRNEFGDAIPGGGDGSDMSSNGSAGGVVRAVKAKTVGGRVAEETERGGATRSRRGSFATQVERFDPEAIAQEGYATPRFCSARVAVTPRTGVKISSHQEDAVTEADALSGRVMESGRTTVNRSEGGKAEFNKRLMLLGKKVGVDMAFASTFNEKIREEQRKRREDIEAGIIDDVTEGDEGYFDDIDVGNGGNWGESEKENQKEGGDRGVGTTLNLSNLHNDIAWGGGIKVDNEPVKLKSREREKGRPKSAKEIRESSRKEGKVVRVKGGRDGGEFYSNYGMYKDMVERDKGTDWYVYNDGTLYVSSSEKRLKEENFNRSRGGLGGRGEGEKHKPFQNYCGKRSSMKLPDKVREGGERRTEGWSEVTSKALYRLHILHISISHNLPLVASLVAARRRSGGQVLREGRLQQPD